MRHLPHCETYATEHHNEAWVALAELSAFLRDQEQRRQVTVVHVELDMDDDADYYGYVVIERPPPVPTRPMTPQSEWDASFSERH